MTDTNGGVEIVAIVEAEAALRRTRRVELAVVVVAAAAALVALGVCIWLVWLVRDCTAEGGDCYEKNRVAALQFRADLEKLVRDNAQCTVLQLLEHRDANEKAHDLNATEHGYRYVAPPGEAPPPIPQQLRDACRQFLPPTQGGTR